jgi:hypothetical protein
MRCEYAHSVLLRALLFQPVLSSSVPPSLICWPPIVTAEPALFLAIKFHLNNPRMTAIRTTHCQSSRIHVWLIILATPHPKWNTLLRRPTAIGQHSVMTIHDLPAELLTDIFEQVVYDDSLVDPSHPTSMSLSRWERRPAGPRLGPRECQRGSCTPSRRRVIRSDEGAFQPAAVSVMILIDLESPGHHVYLQAMVPSRLPSVVPLSFLVGYRPTPSAVLRP